MTQDFKYLFGPVYSWRLGYSLGIDPLSQDKKICNFDCVYCQLGATDQAQLVRQEFISVQDMMKEVNAIPAENIDHYTFSARGEPTLAKNLGQMIEALYQANRRKIAVITNATLLDQKDVQDDLRLADCVLAKLDASGQRGLDAINRPLEEKKFTTIVDNIKAFKARYPGKLCLQIMFVKDNIRSAEDIAVIARDIHPDEVQLNTPTRPCGVLPVSKSEMDEIKKYFKGLNVVCVYDAEKKDFKPLNVESTEKRHGVIQDL